MSKKVLILGGSGHGSIIASCISDNRLRYNDLEWEVIGFLNDYETKIDSYSVLGTCGDIHKFINEDYYFAWGIHLMGCNPLTYQAFERIKIPLERLATIVHHSAFIGENVILEPGVLVMPNSYIASRSHIGFGTMIKSNVCIGHDVECGPLCHFAMGSITGSYTKLGICSDVAIGATVLEKLNIGNYSMVGAHSLLTHDVPDYEIYVGSPAKFMKRIREN